MTWSGGWDGGSREVAVKIAAIFLIIVGVVCLLLGASWDTTPSGYVNFHAVSQQQTLLMIGGFTFLGGLVTLGFERMRPKSYQSSESTVQPNGLAKGDSDQPQPSPTEQLPEKSASLNFSQIGKTLSPDYRLRFAVAFGTSLPIAYLTYQSLMFFQNTIASAVIIVVAIGYSLIPGNTAIRLKQMFWAGTALCVVLAIDQIRMVTLLKQEYGMPPDYGDLFLVVVVGAGYLGCTKFVGRWVARLQEKELGLPTD